MTGFRNKPRLSVQVQAQVQEQVQVQVAQAPEPVQLGFLVRLRPRLRVVGTVSTVGATFHD